MRNVADASNLADIVLVRRLISLHHLVPLPADAIVTPVTFTVPKRSEKDAARGFLRYDCYANVAILKLMRSVATST
jgi:hypothetical protein